MHYNETKKDIFMLVHRGPFFLFVCSYSHATLLDHGGVLVNHFFPSAVPPRRAGSVTATRALRLAFPSTLPPYLASTGN